MDPTAGNALADAARKIDWCYCGEGAPDATVSALRAALKQWDAQADVRHAEREFIDTAVLWAQTIIAKLQGTYPSEVVDRLRGLLAARAGAPHHPKGDVMTHDELDPDLPPLDEAGALRRILRAKPDESLVQAAARAMRPLIFERRATEFLEPPTAHEVARTLLAGPDLRVRLRARTQPPTGALRYADVISIAVGNFGDFCAVYINPTETPNE